MTRISATGEYAIRIPAGLKLSASGKIDYSDMDTKKSVTIYQSIDTPTREMSDILKWAEKNRFATGSPSSTFTIDDMPFQIKKERSSNMFSLNGSLMTKEQLERYMKILSNKHLNDEYYSKILKAKFMGKGDSVEDVPPEE